MKTVFWLLLFAFAAAAAWLVWHSLRKWEARKRAEQERVANFIAGTTAAAAKPKPAAPLPASLPAPLPVPSPEAPADSVPVPSNNLAQQKLLFEAAHKAGEASEPALAIQLYARLLARYPATAFAGQVRTAVEALKKKLIKG